MITVAYWILDLITIAAVAFGGYRYGIYTCNQQVRKRLNDAKRQMKQTKKYIDIEKEKEAAKTIHDRGL